MKRAPIMRGLRRLLLMGVVLSCGTCFAQAVDKTLRVMSLPGDSIYQLGDSMTDQDGRQFKLAERRGKPLLISMFYNSCQFVCPMLIDTVRITQQSLTPEERDRLSIMLVTFDPVRDNVKVLKSMTQIHALDPAHWTFALGDPPSVRKIAAALDIQYRLLDNGEYNHTTVLVLLDENGRVIGRTKKLGVVDPAFLALVRKAVSAGKPHAP